MFFLQIYFRGFPSNPSWHLAIRKSTIVLLLNMPLIRQFLFQEQKITLSEQCVQVLITASFQPLLRRHLRGEAGNVGEMAV
jgi:hypothetical protein